MNSRPSFEVSADTRFLTQRLARVEVGEVISYDALGQEIGRPVSGATPALISARRGLLRERHMVFDVVRGEGLKRLADGEIVGTSSRTAKRIRNAARRGVETLTAVADFSGLSREDQMRHTAALSVFGVVAEMTGSRGIAKVERMTEGRREALPMAATFEAFRTKR